MLMLVYGIDELTAFELLKWRSQEANVKLRVLAEQIATDFLELSGGATLPPRSAYDNVLLTAHLRIDAKTNRGTLTSYPHRRTRGGQSRANQLRRPSRFKQSSSIGRKPVKADVPLTVRPTFAHATGVAIGARKAHTHRTDTQRACHARIARTGRSKRSTSPKLSRPRGISLCWRPVLARGWRPDRRREPESTWGYWDPAR
jgi:hypothetical protein